jgi:excisionase family DNA binding protein
MSRGLHEEYLTVAQAAARLRVNKSTIRRWIDQGALPAYRVGQRRVALRESDIARLISPIRKPPAGADGTATLEVPGGPRLTPAEQKQAAAAVDAARRSQAEQLAKRGGVPFSPSWELINELRDERSRQLA